MHNITHPDDVSRIANSLSSQVTGGFELQPAVIVQPDDASRTVNAPAVIAQPDDVSRIVSALSAQFTGGFDPQRMALAITLAMKLADSMRTDGPSKKDIVVRAINAFAEQAISDPENLESSKKAIRLFAPGIIDTIVAASKGQVLLKKWKLWCC